MDGIYDESTLTAGLAALGLFAIIFVIVFIFLIVFYVIGRWKLYQKAGKSGWEAIVPFYNDWVYVEIAGLNPWWFLLVVATTICSVLDIEKLQGVAWIASVVGLYFCNYNISKKLHKDTGFAILMTIFPFIVVPIVGISKSYTWDGDVVVSKNGPIKDDGNTNTATSSNTTTETTTEEKKDDDTKKDTKEDNKDIKYCPHCGKEVDKDSKFCGNCGKEI